MVSPSATLRRVYRNRREICIGGWCALSFVGLVSMLLYSIFSLWSMFRTDLEHFGEGWLYVSLRHGSSLTILGPTLLDIMDNLCVGLATLAAIIMVRSVGSVVGSVASGVVCDRYYKYSFWMLVADIIISALLTCVLPLADHVSVFGVIMFFHGLCLGALDNGVHALLMSIFRNQNSGPVMQLIHFAFGFGAFLVPFMARPFVSELGGSITCTEVLKMNRTQPGICLNGLIDECTSNDGSGVFNGSIFINSSSCSSCSVKNTSLRYAFWLASIPLMLSLLGLLTYAIKEQCLFAVVLTDDRQLDATKKGKEVQPEQVKTYPDTICYKTVLLSLLFVFMMVYVGLEVAFGTYIFTYAVKGDLKFSKQKAASLSSLFWGTFAFLRLFAILLSLCRISPTIMMTGNISGSLLASLIMVVWARKEIVIWIGSALMGTSMASIYPNTMTWLSMNGPVTGKATGVLSTGATLGDMLLPLLVGVLIAKISPISLLYFTLTSVVFSGSVLVILFVIARKCKITMNRKEVNHNQLIETEQNLLDNMEEDADLNGEDREADTNISITDITESAL